MIRQQLEPPNYQSQIIVQKDRQEQNDKVILNEWRNARINFFTQQIQRSLREANATEHEQKQIMGLFMGKQSFIDLYQFKHLYKYMKNIQQLHNSLLQIKEKYQKRQGECLLLQKIIKQQLNTLQVIRIQYQLTIKDFNLECRYSICAFQLFKVVHANNLLKEVTLRGVKIQAFQYFINLLNRVLHNQAIEQRQRQRQKNNLIWINNFNPPKSISLSINANFSFDFQGKDDSCSQIKDWTFFQKFFYCLSDISVRVKIEKWKNINLWEKSLRELWQCLKRVKKIKLQILRYGYEQISVRQIAAIRSNVFGGLASLTEITHLILTGFQFSSQIGINHFLAFEQSLSVLFKNNNITSLRLNCCKNFLVFPRVTTLQSLDLHSVRFRKQFNIMRDMYETSKSLKFMKCSYIPSL